MSGATKAITLKQSDVGLPVIVCRLGVPLPLNGRGVERSEP